MFTVRKMQLALLAIECVLYAVFVMIAKEIDWQWSENAEFIWCLRKFGGSMRDYTYHWLDDEDNMWKTDNEEWEHLQDKSVTQNWEGVQNRG